MERLAADVPLAREERSREQHARWLLAQMLEWHRREERVIWWEYFRLRDLTDEEMLDERSAIAGLRLMKRLEKVNKSYVDRYSYPRQETDVRVGDDLKTSLVDKGRYGEVVANRKLRTKMRVPARVVSEIDQFLRAHALLVTPADVSPKICRDKRDLPILGTAKAGNATFLVTGDKDLLDVGTYSGTDIVTPRQLWERLRSRKPST